jgi:hypothetical protein
MPSRTEPDPSELLAKALDLVVGGVTLARYAARHTPDRRLQRTFKRLEQASEHQARALREQLAGYSLNGAVGASHTAAGGSAAFIAGATSAAVILAGSVLAFRVLTAPPQDPLRRAVLGTLSQLGRLFGAGGAPKPAGSTLET